MSLNETFWTCYSKEVLHASSSRIQSAFGQTRLSSPIIPAPKFPILWLTSTRSSKRKALAATSRNANPVAQCCVQTAVAAGAVFFWSVSSRCVRLCLSAEVHTFWTPAALTNCPAAATAVRKHGPITIDEKCPAKGARCTKSQAATSDSRPLRKRFRECGLGTWHLSDVHQNGCTFKHRER